MATLEIALSIGFAVLVGKAPQAGFTPAHFALARSQKKDNWLACGLIWCVVLAQDSAVRQVLWIGGGLVLGWLIQRTLHRMRTLQRRA